MNMVMRGFVRVPSAPANTPHAKTHSRTLHLLAVAGCECIKNTVCDVWLREKTASWHRWCRAKIQLITANIRPLQRKAAQTTNMSSRREPRSKDLEVEKGKQGKGAGPSSRWKRPIGDRINRWNMLRKARMWGEAQMNRLSLQEQCVGLELSWKPVLKVVLDQCLCHLHSNDDTHPHTQTHSLVQVKVHMHSEGKDLMYFSAPVAGFQCSDVDKWAALLGRPAVWQLCCLWEGGVGALGAAGWRGVSEG